jgi:DNA-directed RNA polymerase
MVTSKLIIKSKNEKYYILAVDESLCQIGEKSIIDFPLKLPMIVKPKHYSKGKLGGYLLNDVRYKENLIIHKNIIKDSSYVKDDNIIYNMVNNISNVPYKINTDLLDYLITDKHGLLIDSNNPSKYVNIANRTKYQQVKYTSDMSKLNLQEIVLGLADFYKNFSEIYFPLRMDQRGRLYCSTTYLNYQSNELAKSLLLFAKPGIISKKDLRAIKYLEFYGVNCFGKDKLSDQAKIQ